MGWLALLILFGGQCESLRSGISREADSHVFLLCPSQSKHQHIGHSGESVASKRRKRHAHRAAHQETNGGTGENRFLAGSRIVVLPHERLQDIRQEVHRHRLAPAHLHPPAPRFLPRLFARMAREVSPISVHVHSSGTVSLPFSAKCRFLCASNPNHKRWQKE